MSVLVRVISGGQTGVDRAALDAAMACGLTVGGWVPRGRLAEDGRVPDRYPLHEMTTTSYPARTRANVEAADATLILTDGEPEGGTLLTRRACVERDKPNLVIYREDLGGFGSVVLVRAWLARFDVRVLNCAGPRESKAPGIYAAAAAFLGEVFRAGGLTET